MSLISCSECGKQISSKASTCPQCGAKNARKDWGLGKKLIGGIFILFVAAFIVTTVQRNLNSDKAAAQDAAASQQLRFEALKDSCKDAVRARLKAPSTADFPEPIDVTVSRKNPADYSVSGAVDAQNGFGAKLRQNYTCGAHAGISWDKNAVYSVTFAK